VAAVATIVVVTEPEADADGVERRRRHIVCGDNTLAYRLVTELGALPDTDVVLLSRRGRGGTISLDETESDLELIHVDELDAAAFGRARIDESDAIAFLDQSDIGNLDAALLARELAPGIRIVLRMFDEVLAESVHDLLTDCVVLSATAVAAPAFVSAVGGQTPTPLRLFGRPMFVTDRGNSRPEDVVCGLAVTQDVAEPRVLPDPPGDADVVLTRVVTDAEKTVAPASAADVHRRAQRRAVLATLSLIALRLRPLVAALALIVIAGTFTLAPIEHVSWWKGFYLAMLSTLSGSSPDLSATLGLQVLHIVFTILSIAVIPLVTAAVVEIVVSARLALASGGLIGPIDSHVVVVGLGDLGTRVLIALDDLGIAVVAIDRDGHARGVEVARERRIPVIVGDAGRQETLRSASAHTARCVVVLTSSDLVNVQTALLGRKANPGVRSVLRVFDTEFAGRVQRTFGFTSRSVSALAAPSFAAAMLDHAVVATIPVRRRVLLVAEIPIEPRSLLEGCVVGDLQRPGATRVIAIRTGRGAQVLWAPPVGRRLTRNDTLLVVTNRGGLGDLLHRAAASEHPPPITPYDAPPQMPRPTTLGSVDAG